MNRQEFMSRLERLLYDIPVSDRQEALEYYENYFEDAGVENEAYVIQELGSPERVAAEIKAGFEDDRSHGTYTDTGYSDERFREENPIRKRTSAYHKHSDSKRRKIILGVILAVITFPIWGAVAGALCSVAAGILGALVGLVIGSLAGGIGLFVAAVVLAVVGIPYISTSVGLGVLVLGIALILLAIGILLLLAFGWFATKAIPTVVRWMIDFVKRMIEKVKGGLEE